MRSSRRVAPGQEGLQRAQQRARVREALVLALEQAAVDDGGQLRRHVRQPSSRRRGIGSSSIAVTMSCGPRSGSNGCFPAIIRNNMMPTAQMSVRWSMGTPMPHCSGDMYGMVPMMAPRRVRLEMSSPELRRRRAAAALAIGAEGRLLLVALEHLGDAEVEHLDGARLGHEDVLGLEVAVDDALLVGARQRAHHRHHQLHRARGRQALAGDQLHQRLAL